MYLGKDVENIKSTNNTPVVVSNTNGVVSVLDYGSLQKADKADNVPIMFGLTKSPSIESWRTVAYGNVSGIDVYISISQTGKSAVSYDGINWFFNPMPNLFEWTDIGYYDGYFVTVAREVISGDVSPRVAYSADGLNWNSVNVPSNGWRALTYGAGRYVSLAYAHQVVVGQQKIMYADSGDLDNWTLVSSPNNAPWIRVRYGNGVFVGIAPAVTGDRNGLHLTMYSLDGINWQTNPSVDDTMQWVDMTYGAGKFVAVALDTKHVGNIAVPVNPDEPQIMVSEDGQSWTPVVPPFVSRWRTITYDDEKFIVVSATGEVLISYDAYNWEQVFVTSTITSVSDISFGNGLVFGFGANSDDVLVSDTITTTIPSIDNFEHGDTLLFRKDVSLYCNILTTIDPNDTILGNGIHGIFNEDVICLTADKNNRNWFISNKFDYKEPNFPTKLLKNDSLTSLSNLVLSSGDIIVSTASDSWDVIPTSTTGRTFLSNTDAADFRSFLTLGDISNLDVGTSGTAIPVLDNTYHEWSGKISFPQTSNASICFASVNNLGFFSNNTNELSLDNKNSTEVIKLKDEQLIIGNMVTTTVNNGTSKTVVNFDNTQNPIIHTGGVFGIWLRVNETDGKLISFYKDDNEVGWISSDSTDIYFSTISDSSVKENIIDLESNNITMAIKPYKYDWKHNTLSSYGFLAHELQEVLPEAVVGIKDTEQYQSVDLKKILPHLVSDIQNLLNELETFENEIK